jgi:lipopolysaccharide heptosyltransferase II
MERIRSVLVVRLSALGDVLFALPAVAALAQSQLAGHIAWLVEDKAAALLDGWPGVDELVIFPRRHPSRWPAHALAMRARRDPVTLDFQGTLKSRLQLALLRSPRKIGFAAGVAREGAERALTERVEPPSWARHRVAQNLALLSAFGLSVPRQPARPALVLPPAARERMADFVAGLHGDGPLAVLHPGTSAFGEFKRWPAARFAELGDRLVRGRGARLVLTAGPGEAALVEAVRGALHARAVIAPTTSLHELSALLAAADLVVASDSLPLHLANFHGTPVVGLYGPKDPARTGPFFDRSRVVLAGVACSPCTLRRCGDRICMDQLPVEAVLRAAEELLDEAAA